MEYIFETAYDQKALTTMARVVRKTVRKKHSRRSHILGWLVVLFGVLMFLPLNGAPIIINFKKIVTGLVLLILIFTLLFEDKINGYFAKKRMLPGTANSIAKFTEDGYLSETNAGKTEWQYKNIDLIVETNEYFAFVFGKNHAQFYDKKHLTGGTIDEFREFIQNKTGKQLQKIK